MSISINEAHSLLEQLKQQEISLGRAPDTWYTYENHVIGTAELAWLIASEIKEMNPDKLYVKGLLHDICRTEEDRKQRFHGILGYEKLIQKDSDVARACLLHMFLWNKLPPYQECHDLFYQKEEDYNFIAEYIINHNPSNEDYLIQLCDYLANKDGYVTLYEYLNQIIVKDWDIVQRWQLIWYSGWEPGTMWAWFNSEWENLTFWVYKDWVAIDPLTILDLSVVTDRENTLPEDYRLKYLNDQLVRPIDVSDLKIMEWKTVDERAQRLLNGYGVWVYRDLDFWNSVVEWTNIDRDVVICIWVAESTLGKHLTTSNNIWNVGNNDRWDRIAYDTPYAWARLIASTLNNQYLWWYHTINQLSRYGNEDGKIYASSPINWQRNVMKCLSKIKWYTVPEDFPFRTWPNPNLE